jgi:hypothetical protein
LIAKEGWHWDGGWSGPGDADVKVGYVDVVFETAQYRQTQDKLKPIGDRDAGGRLQGAAVRETAMQRLPAGEQTSINQEANRQFWARTGYKVGHPLDDSPEDRQQAKLWFEIRDEVLSHRDKLKSLPPEIKSVLGGEGAIPPKDYEKALLVAGKLAKLDPKDRAMYQLHGVTDGIDELDRRLDQATAKPGDATESPAELSRLLQVFKDRVKDPQFSDGKGQSWLKFAKFLDLNKDKIEASSRAIRQATSRRPRSIRSSASTASSLLPSPPATRNRTSSRLRMILTRSSSTTRAGRSCPRKIVGC